MVTFAADAFVNDQLLGYWDKTAIRDWAERDIIGERLKISTTKVVRHYDSLIVTADIDGNFDEGGLPGARLGLLFLLTTITSSN